MGIDEKIASRPQKARSKTASASSCLHSWLWPKNSSPFAKKLEVSLEQNNLTPTSFDRDTLELLPDDAQKLRRDLLDITSSNNSFEELSLLGLLSA